MVYGPRKEAQEVVGSVWSGESARDERESVSGRSRLETKSKREVVVGEKAFRVPEVAAGGTPPGEQVVGRRDPDLDLIEVISAVGGALVSTRL